MLYMLDTNMCIYIIKQRPETVLQKFRSLHLGDVGISSVTLAELNYGVEKSQQQTKNSAALEQFILPLEIAAFDDLASQHYGRIRTALEKVGRPIGALDLMIAAHAVSLDCILVTNNEREFLRVDGLNVENWAVT